MNVDIGALNPRTVQGASALATAVGDALDKRYPPNSRPGTYIYNIRVKVKVATIGPFPIYAHTLTLAGEIKDDETFKEVAPGIVFDKLGLRQLVDEYILGSSSSCGDACQTAVSHGTDVTGTQYVVEVTYMISYVCSAGNCTFTATAVSATVTRLDDGSPYFGPALVANADEEFDGPN